MTKAAITPGTHPQNVKSKTIKKEPQPFPMTDKGGNKIVDLLKVFTMNYSLNGLCVQAFSIRKSFSSHFYSRNFVLYIENQKP